MANLHLHPFIHASSLRPKRSWRIRSPSPSHQRQWWGWLLSIFFLKLGLRTWHLVQVSSGGGFAHIFSFWPPGEMIHIFLKWVAQTATSQATDQGATATIPANLYTMAQLPCLWEMFLTWGEEMWPWLGYFEFRGELVNWWWSWGI